MRPFIGGLLIGVGLAWLVTWAMLAWFVHNDIFSRGYVIPRSSDEAASFDQRGRSGTRRAASIARRGTPIAVAVIAAGIIVAAT